MISWLQAISLSQTGSFYAAFTSTQLYSRQSIVHLKASCRSSDEKLSDGSIGSVLKCTCMRIARDRKFRTKIADFEFESGGGMFTNSCSFVLNILCHIILRTPVASMPQNQSENSSQLSEQVLILRPSILRALAALGSPLNKRDQSLA